MFLVTFLGFIALSEGIQVTPEPIYQTTELPVGYRTYQQMKEFLMELSSNYSELASVYTIGKTVEGRELWVLKIQSPSVPVLGTPNVKLIGNIHGNEPVGRELILVFAEYLLKNYKKDNEVKWILDRTIIHLLPSLNPDGFEKSKEGLCYAGPGRANGNFVDLNRSFPDQFQENRVPVQPETRAVADWMSQVTFVLSASFHGGALVANYPFDSNPGNDSSQSLMEELMANVTRGDNLVEIWQNLTPNERDSLVSRSSPTPDDDVFKHLAQVYSNSHLTMHKGRTCNENQPSFPGGITNGAAWYSFAGGMQDYNYLAQGCMELTLEISCCKYPHASHLPRLWAENKKAMLDLVKQAHLGVKGLVLDKVTSQQVKGVILRISGRNVPFTTSKNGEFWRVLLPGNYLLIAEAKGYETQSFPVHVSASNMTYPSPTWLNVYLNPVEDLLESASPNMAQMVENSGSFHSLSLPVSFCLPIFFSLFTRRGLS